MPRQAVTYHPARRAGEAPGHRHGLAGAQGLLIARGMRIECPACGAAYDVPEHLLTRPDGTPARPVRCLRCAHQWQPAAPAPETPSASAPSPTEAAADAGPTVPHPVLPARHAAPVQLQPGPAPLRTVRQEGSPAAPLLAWAASLALLAVVLALLVRQRESVMAAWPPATHLFQALGLY